MPKERRDRIDPAERRLHLLALPLAILGLAVGALLIRFDPVVIARQATGGSLGRAGIASPSVPVPIPVDFTEAELRRIRQLSPVPPVPPDPTNGWADDPRAVRLGHALFFDPLLSGPGTLSCASCHDPGRWFADGLPTSQGLLPGTRNTQSLVNVGYGRWFHWDGRHDSLWSQALEPLERESEMAGNRVAIVRRIARDPEYRAAYESIFGGLPALDGRGASRIPDAGKPMSDAPQHPMNAAWESIGEADRERINRAFANVGKALAAYQRQLVERSTPFDRFVAGLSEDGTTSSHPLSPEELRGLKLFIGRANCTQCHHGPLLTDGEFHNIGLPSPDGGMPRDPGRYAGVDLLKRNEFRANGRFSDDRESTPAILTDAVVNSPENWGRFRTPSLRGVGRTAPYMHAGHFETLEEVVRFYSTLEGAVQLDHHQETVLQPLLLSDAEILDLVAFLGALSAAGPRDDLVEPPAGPRSGPRVTRGSESDRRGQIEPSSSGRFAVSRRPSDG